MKSLILLSITLLLIGCGNNHNKEIAIVGDSTVAVGPLKKSIQGWGVYIDESKSVNFAVGGESSKSYYNKYWKDVLESKPKYVLIQFGINDAKEDYRSTDPNSDFREYLQSYINESREIGAEIIFVTSPNRVTGLDVLPYVEAMREVALKNGVMVIDLYSFSLEIQEEYRENIKDIYVDDVHTNSLGASIYADFIMESLSDFGI